MLTLLAWIWLAGPVAAQPPAESPPLAVVIDAGHGGKDMGAVVKRVAEKHVCFAVAHRLAVRLEKIRGLRPVLVRDSDFYLPLDERITRSLKENRAIFISLHADDFRDPRPHGISVYSWGPDRHKRPHHHPHLKPLPPPPKNMRRLSLRLADRLARSLRAQGIAADLDRADDYVLKNPRQPAVLIELGFLSNPRDRANLTDPAYQDRLADALAKSLEASLTLLPSTPQRSALNH